MATRLQKHTIANKGYDASPVYTYDGKYILYRSQATEGFEADRWRIMRYDRKTGEIVELTRGYDFMLMRCLISPDSKTVYFTSGVAVEIADYECSGRTGFTFANRNFCQTRDANQRFRRFAEYYA